MGQGRKSDQYRHRDRPGQKPGREEKSDAHSVEGLRHFRGKDAAGWIAD